MKILCFGDSNTWGHNPIDCSRLEKPWSRVLSAILSDCEIIEDGVCGRTTSYDFPGEEGKNGIVSFNEYIEAGNGADLLVVMLGTNDTLNYFKKNAKESADNLREYIRLWKERFGTKVLVISPVHITNCALRHDTFSQLYSHDSVVTSHQFAAEYEKMANEEGVEFLDASLYAEPDSADGIHLSPEAHEFLAKAVADKIRSME